LPKGAVPPGRPFAFAPVARVGRTGAQVLCDAPRIAIEFGRDAFAGDPRLSGMVWDRPRAR